MKCIQRNKIISKSKYQYDENLKYHGNIINIIEYYPYIAIYILSKGMLSKNKGMIHSEEFNEQLSQYELFMSRYDTYTDLGFEFCTFINTKNVNTGISSNPIPKIKLLLDNSNNEIHLFLDNVLEVYPYLVNTIV